VGLEGVVETGDEYAGPKEVAAIGRTKAKPKERLVRSDMLDLPFAGLSTEYLKRRCSSGAKPTT
jgi:hypothetical protein